MSNEVVIFQRADNVIVIRMTPLQYEMFASATERNISEELRSPELELITAKLRKVAEIYRLGPHCAMGFRTVHKDKVLEALREFAFQCAQKVTHSYAGVITDMADALEAFATAN